MSDSTTPNYGFNRLDTDVENKAPSLRDNFDTLDGILADKLDGIPTVYYSTDFPSLAAAVAAIGSAVADLVITTANWPDGDSVVVPATLRLRFEGEGSL